ncbi:MAG: hypothetical protein IJR20_03195 [Muribaculaceae bacterium]|nr:hypothetical protein [Muribaculaceae bacterium]
MKNLEKEKPLQEQIEIALEIAMKAHKGQRDLDDKPVILHPLSIALKGKDPYVIIAGLLHDVVEDTDFTFEYMLNAGISPKVVEALKLLTHNKEVPYEEYVQQIAESGNDIAINVKYNDLCHNLMRGRAGGYWRIVAKHEKALAVIEPLIKNKP